MKPLQSLWNLWRKIIQNFKMSQKMSSTGEKLKKTGPTCKGFSVT